MVKTLSCGLRDPGSIPGRGKFFYSHTHISPLFSQDLLLAKSHQVMTPSTFWPPISLSHGMYEPISPRPGPTDASLGPPRDATKSLSPPRTLQCPSST